MQRSARPAAITSEGSWTTPAACARSRTRRRTRTAGSCRVTRRPGSRTEWIGHLQTDYMLLKTVFPQHLLEKYEELKLDEQLQASLRPSPYEFYRYMDA